MPRESAPRVKTLGVRVRSVSRTHKLFVLSIDAVVYNKLSSAQKLLNHIGFEGLSVAPEEESNLLTTM